MLFPEERRMKNRSLLFTLAMAVLAGCAFATTSQASSVLVDTTASFTLTSPPGATATDVSFTYNSTAISALALVTAPAGTTISSNGTNTITLDFAPPTGGPVALEWTFVDPGPGPIGVTVAFAFSGTPRDARGDNAFFP
jgi:hypothetical protein